MCVCVRVGCLCAVNRAANGKCACLYVHVYLCVCVFLYCTILLGVIFSDKYFKRFSCGAPQREGGFLGICW
jgi:hypothetical protein